MLAVRFVELYPFEFEAVFPCGIPIATDGSGNFWVVDVVGGGTWGAVFFVAHDPAVVMLQSRDIGAFIDRVLAAPSVEELTSVTLSRLVRDNPNAVPRAQAATSGDPRLRLFAQRFDDRYSIVDLREHEEGSGFVWGTAGPDTNILRDGDALLFGIENKKCGVLARLFLMLSVGCTCILQ